MSYSELIKRAAKTVWRNKGIWLFGMIASLFTKVPGTIQNEVTTNILSANKKDVFFSVLGILSDVTPVRIASFISILLLSFIIGLFVLYVSQGAMISLAAGSTQGVDFSAMSALKVGIEKVVSLTAIAGLIWLIYMSAATAVGFLLYMPFLLLRSSGQIALIALLAITALFVIVAVAGLIFAGLLTIISSRVAVIKRKKVLASIAQGFAVIKKNLRKAIVLWLVSLAFSVGIAIVAAILFLPFQMAISSTFTLTALRSLLTVISLLILVSAVLYGLVEAFFSTLWTLFYLDIDLEDTQPSFE